MLTLTNSYNFKPGFGSSALKTHSTHSDRLVHILDIYFVVAAVLFMFMTKSSMGAGVGIDCPSLSRPPAPSSSNEVYRALYEYACEQRQAKILRADADADARNGNVTDVVDISPIVEWFLVQFREDLVKFGRHVFPIPDFSIEFVESSKTFDVTAAFKNVTVTGAESLGLDGQANLTMLDDENLQLDIPFHFMSGDLNFDLDLNVGSLGPGKAKVEGVIVGPARHLVGVRVTPWEVRINELLTVDKATLDAKIKGYDTFFRWLEFGIYFGIVILVLFVLLIVLCVYLAYSLRKERKYNQSLK